MSKDIKYNTGDLSRGRHNPESAAAHRRLKPYLKDCQTRVLIEFLNLGESGGTVKTVARIMKIPLNHVSGRITELKKAGYISKTGLRCEGCAVVKITGEGRKALKRIT